MAGAVGDTSHAARAAGEEAVSGSIAVGKRADFTVFDVDPLAADPDRLAHGQILATVVDGQMRHLALTLPDEQLAPLAGLAGAGGFGGRGLAPGISPQFVGELVKEGSALTVFGRFNEITGEACKFSVGVLAAVQEEMERGFGVDTEIAHKEANGTFNDATAHRRAVHCFPRCGLDFTLQGRREVHYVAVNGLNRTIRPQDTLARSQDVALLLCCVDDAVVIAELASAGASICPKLAAMGKIFGMLVGKHEFQRRDDLATLVAVDSEQILRPQHLPGADVKVERSGQARA